MDMREWQRWCALFVLYVLGVAIITLTLGSGGRAEGRRGYIPAPCPVGYCGTPTPCPVDPAR